MENPLNANEVVTQFFRQFPRLMGKVLYICDYVVNYNQNFINSRQLVEMHFPGSLDSSNSACRQLIRKYRSG